MNLYFFVLTRAPDDDDALKLLDPLAATHQIGERMDVRRNGDENRTMKAFTAIGQLWRMIMLGSSQKGRARARKGFDIIFTLPFLFFFLIPSSWPHPSISPWPWALLE